MGQMGKWYTGVLIPKGLTDAKETYLFKVVWSGSVEEEASSWIHEKNNGDGKRTPNIKL